MQCIWLVHPGDAMPWKITDMIICVNMFEDTEHRVRDGSIAQST